MPSVAFAAPMLPGETEADRSAMQSCSHGERKASYESSREQHGISREAVWIQQTPGGDFAVVYMEADDLQAARKIFIGAPGFEPGTSPTRITGGDRR
jgi:hypothetical protein